MFAVIPKSALQLSSTSPETDAAQIRVYLKLINVDYLKNLLGRENESVEFKRQDGAGYLYLSYG